MAVSDDDSGADAKEMAMKWFCEDDGDCESDAIKMRMAMMMNKHW